MTDYDMTNYDENKISINQYVNLLAEFNKKLVNIKNNHIPIETRKRKAFELLLKEVIKLDGDELETWKDRLENIFNPKVKAEKVKNDLRVEKDLSDFKLGEIVLIYTKYKVDSIDYDIYVKCKIDKINKCSIRLQKYKCDLNFDDYNNGIREQTFGKLYFNWTDELETDKSKQNFINIKNVDKICRSDWDLYNSYIKQTYHITDFGR